jgi:hypothetical protein
MTTISKECKNFLCTNGNQLNEPGDNTTTAGWEALMMSSFSGTDIALHFMLVFVVVFDAIVFVYHSHSITQ